MLFNEFYNGHKLKVDYFTQGLYQPHTILPPNPTLIILNVSLYICTSQISL